MAIKVVGAGLGRTGTLSLKLALERLLGEPCYHMAEVLSHPEHISFWRQAFKGEMPDWGEIFKGFAATVDEPAACFWEEISRAFPDALVLLSVRDAESWYQSADRTIFNDVRNEAPPGPPFISDWHAMVVEMTNSLFPNGVDDKRSAMDVFERHNRNVREAIPASRLLVWHPSDGWGPICAALGLPVPDEPFPRTNTRAEWAK